MQINHIIIYILIVIVGLFALNHLRKCCKEIRRANQVIAELSIATGMNRSNTLSTIEKSQTIEIMSVMNPAFVERITKELKDASPRMTTIIFT